MLNLAIIIEALTGFTADQILQVSASNEFKTSRCKKMLALVFIGGVIDSRQASEKMIFIALPGENVDGHDFVYDAFEHGAGLAIVSHRSADTPILDLRSTSSIDEITASLNELNPTQQFCILVENSLLALQKIARHWRSKLNLRVIGITGSVGKSTTKELTANLLSQRFVTLRNPGNLNNEIGLPLTLLSLTEKHERAVLEMGFYVPGEIAFLCELAKPVIGVITNIGTVHAERAGSMDAIARGKAELVQALPPLPEGYAVLNFDDPRVRAMAGKTKARVFFYGLSPEANLWADEVEGLGLAGIRFQLHYRKEVIHMRVPLIGRHSVHTALRAAAVGLIEGLTWQEIVNGLRSERTQLRLVTVRSRHGALILDDTYNASPESSLAALNLLDELGGRKIAVLGDMLELGIYEKEGHELVGIRATEVVDTLVTVGKLARQIAQSAWRAGLPKNRIFSFEDNEQVIDYLDNQLGEGDVVLIKGSHGMHMERIVSALEDSTEKELAND